VSRSWWKFEVGVIFPVEPNPPNGGWHRQQGSRHDTEYRHTRLRLLCNLRTGFDSDRIAFARNIPRHDRGRFSRRAGRFSAVCAMAERRGRLKGYRHGNRGRRSSGHLGETISVPSAPGLKPRGQGQRMHQRLCRAPAADQDGRGAESHRFTSGHEHARVKRAAVCAVSRGLFSKDVVRRGLPAR